MRAIRRKIRVASILIVLSLAIVACGSSSKRPNDTQNNQITLNLVTYSLNGAWGRAEELVIQQYDALHPEIQFDRRDL